MTNKNYSIEINTNTSVITELFSGLYTKEEFDIANAEVVKLMSEHGIKTRIAKFKNSIGVYCTVTTDPSMSLIKDVWTGSFGTQKHFIQVIDYVMNRIKDHKLSFWLANLSDMVGIFDSSSPYLIDIVMTNVVKYGLKKEAIVLPKHFSSTLTTKDALIKLEKVGKLEVGHFITEFDAMSWLNNK
jgi:hypothetical protein